MYHRAMSKRLSDEQVLRIVGRAIEAYEGDAMVLESAIGAFMLGRWVGWQPLRLMHSRLTWNRYQEILGVKFMEVLEARTEHSEEMWGIRLADKIGRFWQVFSGALVPGREAARKRKV